MSIYELISEIYSSNPDHRWDNLLYSFNLANRVKLEDAFDIEVFDLFRKAYGITIIYRSDRNEDDAKIEYRKHGDVEIVPFTNPELNVFDNLDWRRLPHILKAHIYDVIWLFNRKYKAAIVALEEYNILYHEWFDEVDWVQCVDYISRSIELAAKIGHNSKKEELLSEVYDDIVRLNGEDSSLLSVSLIELIIDQDYSCDLKALLPLVDKLISKNVNTAYIVERAYYVKAGLYKKL